MISPFPQFSDNGRIRTSLDMAHEEAFLLVNEHEPTELEIAEIQQEEPPSGSRAGLEQHTLVGSFVGDRAGDHRLSGDAVDEIQIHSQVGWMGCRKCREELV